MQVPISGSGRSPGGGNGNPIQYSCLENPMDRGAWLAIVHAVIRELDMTEQLSMHRAIVMLCKPLSTQMTVRHR